MASGVDKKLSKNLECAVCFEVFRDPKVLSCQHTYCRECLERMVKTNAQNNKVNIECPECRGKTKIPRGGVKNLKSNFLVKKLLSDLDSHADKNLFCEKHDDEKLKLFCQTCDLLICRDCVLIDHRDHNYKFVREVYPIEKKKMEEAVKESKAKIADMEATIKHLDDLNRKAQANCKKVSSEIDTFIDNQVSLLEKRRNSLKNDLKEFARVQKEERDDLNEVLTTSIKSARQEVGLAEKIMKKGHEGEVLATKTQIMKSLTEEKIDSTVRKRKHEFVLSYYLEAHPPLNSEMLKNMAKIRKRVKVCDDKGDDNHEESSEEGSMSSSSPSSWSSGSSSSLSSSSPSPWSKEEEDSSEE